MLKKKILCNLGDIFYAFSLILAIIYFIIRGHGGSYIWTLLISIFVFVGSIVITWFEKKLSYSIKLNFFISGIWFIGLIYNLIRIL